MTDSFAEPPPIPSNLTILEISSRSVKVAWSVEIGSPGVERLAIQWKEQNEDWFPEGKQTILSGLAKDTLVTGLRPWTVYHLRVFAENQLGKSKEGKVLQVKSRGFLIDHFPNKSATRDSHDDLLLQFVTNGEKPGGAPRNLRITGISSTSLEVAWEDPERRLLHGPIIRYNVGFREYR